MPSFVARVERPDRGGEWISYLRVAPRGDRALGRHGSGSTAARPTTRPSVELIHVDGTEEDLLAACLFESAQVPETEIRARLDVLDADERARLLADLVGERRNRRHRPGRGFEALRYRFEIVSDYGGFRDLQRHRMLTCQWQRLTPDLGAGRPGGGPRGRRSATSTSGRWRSRRPSSSASRRPGCATPRPTRSASATGSATCSTSTPARRCT